MIYAKWLISASFVVMASACSRDDGASAPLPPPFDNTGSGKAAFPTDVSEVNIGRQYYRPEDVYDLDNNNSDQKIFGGEEAELGQFPWHATIKIDANSDQVGTICGATIIGPKLLVTAGHCFFKEVDNEWVVFYEHEYLRVHYGGIALAGRPKATIKDVKIHPKYDQAVSGNYDIALIILDEGISFSDDVQPLSLVESDYAAEHGYLLEISGFGKISVEPKKPSVLQWAEVPFVPRDICNEFQYYRKQVPPTQFCAGKATGGEDACKGDSGGGLVDRQNRRLVGVVSWGDKYCREIGKPGVYTNVAMLRSWIESQAVKHGVKIGTGGHQ